MKVLPPFSWPLLVTCLGVLALEAEVGDDGRVGPEVRRDEERDVAHVLHLRQLRRVVHLVQNSNTEDKLQRLVWAFVRCLHTPHCSNW